MEKYQGVAITDVSEWYKVVCKIKEVENNTRVILCDLLNKRKL